MTSRAPGTPSGTRAGIRSSGTPRLALTVTEAAQALGVGLDFFREYVMPELRWVRRGRKRLVAVAELERWLDREAERVLGEDR